MKKILFLILFGVNLVASGQTECEQCQEKFKSGDFSASKEICISASETGDPICQAFLGIIYLSESNLDSAKIWFEKSAIQGNPTGQNGFGYLYQNGFGGLEKDIEKANEWFLKSAEQGNSDSQFWLGENLILSGKEKEGYEWTLKASMNGSRDAQFNLGALLQNGQGVEKNDTLSIMWFIISATNGNENSKGVVDNLRNRISEEQFKIYLEMTRDFVNKNPETIN